LEELEVAKRDLKPAKMAEDLGRKLEEHTKIAMDRDHTPDKAYSHGGVVLEQARRVAELERALEKAQIERREMAGQLERKIRDTRYEVTVVRRQAIMAASLEIELRRARHEGMAQDERLESARRSYVRRADELRCASREAEEALAAEARVEKLELESVRSELAAQGERSRGMEKILEEQYANVDVLQSRLREAAREENEFEQVRNEMCAARDRIEGLGCELEQARAQLKAGARNLLKVPGPELGTHTDKMGVLPLELSGASSGPDVSTVGLERELEEAYIGHTTVAERVESAAYVERGLNKALGTPEESEHACGQLSGRSNVSAAS
jgi:hypothetical protein